MNSSWLLAKPSHKTSFGEGNESHQACNRHVNNAFPGNGFNLTGPSQQEAAPGHAVPRQRVVSGFCDIEETGSRGETHLDEAPTSSRLCTALLR